MLNIANFSAIPEPGLYNDKEHVTTSELNSIPLP